MKYMLDTDICIYLIKHKSERLLQTLRKSKPGEVGISVITLSELMYGAEKSQWVERNKNALRQFVLPLEIQAFDAQAAVHYNSIRSHLEQQGTPIGAMDLMIAAQARAHQCVLVTNNLDEFSRVPELESISWL